jgi:hypothetical protein
MGQLSDLEEQSVLVTLPSVVLLDDIAHVFDLLLPGEVPFLQGLHCLVDNVARDLEAVVQRGMGVFWGQVVP